MESRPFPKREAEGSNPSRRTIKDETITYDSEVWITQEGKDVIVDTSKISEASPVTEVEQPERTAKILLFSTKP